jgi:hypothetical protein
LARAIRGRSDVLGLELPGNTVNRWISCWPARGRLTFRPRSLLTEGSGRKSGRVYPASPNRSISTAAAAASLAVGLCPPPPFVHARETQHPLASRCSPEARHLPWCSTLRRAHVFVIHLGRRLARGAGVARIATPALRANRWPNQVPSRALPAREYPAGRPLRCLHEPINDCRPALSGVRACESPPSWR